MTTLTTTDESWLVICTIREQWKLPQSVTDDDIRAAFENSDEWRQIELSLTVEELKATIMQEIRPALDWLEERLRVVAWPGEGAGKK